VTTEDDNDLSADSGVKQVGARGPAGGEGPPPMDAPTPRVAPFPRAARSVPSALPWALAVVGLVGALVFGLLWGTASSGQIQNPAVTSAAKAFLTDFFNFNAKSIDADFNTLTGMATGNFSKQANQFFNSAIRTELEKALAESRGQTRELYVQSENATSASMYAVVDQVYVNNKITTPQSDVIRLIINLSLVGSTWKISNVTVLEGATPASAGSASGSAGSSVAGQ
jgi:hypothetical protein